LLIYLDDCIKISARFGIAAIPEDESKLATLFSTAIPGDRGGNVAPTGFWEPAFVLQLGLKMRSHVMKFPPTEYRKWRDRRGLPIPHREK